MAKTISIIIPVFNSENILKRTVSDLLDTLPNYEFEIILVNDGSEDKSWEIASELAHRHSNIKAIDLLKNHGQHTAILCGIAHATGDFLITMDDDLQNPPSEIPKLIQKIEEGYDLVFAKFEQKMHGGYRKVGSKIVGYLNEQIFGKPKNITLTNFRIFTRETANRLLLHRTNYPYIPGLLLISANKVANVDTKHLPRSFGKSNYNLIRILKLVSRLLFNYSSLPLRLVSGVGIVVSIMSFLAGVVYVLKSLLVGVSVPGWTTLVVLLSFLMGFVLIILGIIGEYLARILNQLSVARPYQIRSIVE